LFRECTSSLFVVVWRFGTAMAKASRRVKLTHEVYSVCVQHALMTEREEVMGLLLGDKVTAGDAAEEEIHIWSSLTLRRSDKRPDRCEISPEQLVQAMDAAEQVTEQVKKTTRVVGWYHSHPHITVLPSHVDLRTQLNWQMMDGTFIGLIFGVYNADPRAGTMRHELLGFQAGTSTDDTGVPARIVLQVDVVPLCTLLSEEHSLNALESTAFGGALSQRNMVASAKQTLEEMHDAYEEKYAELEGPGLSNARATCSAEYTCQLTAFIAEELVPLSHHLEDEDYNAGVLADVQEKRARLMQQNKALFVPPPQPLPPEHRVATSIDASSEGHEVSIKGVGHSNQVRAKTEVVDEGEASLPLPPTETQQITAQHIAAPQPATSAKIPQEQRPAAPPAEAATPKKKMVQPQTTAPSGSSLIQTAMMTAPSGAPKDRARAATRVESNTAAPSHRHVQTDLRAFGRDSAGEALRRHANHIDVPDEDDCAASATSSRNVPPCIEQQEKALDSVLGSQPGGSSSSTAAGPRPQAEESHVAANGTFVSTQARRRTVATEDHVAHQHAGVQLAPDQSARDGGRRVLQAEDLEHGLGYLIQESANPVRWTARPLSDADRRKFGNLPHPATLKGRAKIEHFTGENAQTMAEMYLQGRTLTEIADMFPAGCATTDHPQPPQPPSKRLRSSGATRALY